MLSHGQLENFYKDICSYFTQNNYSLFIVIICHYLMQFLVFYHLLVILSPFLVLFTSSFSSPSFYAFYTPRPSCIKLFIFFFFSFTLYSSFSFLYSSPFFTFYFTSCFRYCYYFSIFFLSQYFLFSLNPLVPLLLLGQ